MKAAIISLFFCSLFLGSALISPMSLVGILFVLLIGWSWCRRARHDYFSARRKKDIQSMLKGEHKDMPFLTYKKN